MNLWPKPTDLDPGQCRSCSAPILWTRTTKNRPIPLDPDPDKRVVVTDTGARVVDTYTPHFATCPHADKHRHR